MKRSRRLGETVVDLIVDVAVVGFCGEFAFFAFEKNEYHDKNFGNCDRFSMRLQFKYYYFKIFSLSLSQY
jgi:hypothetical protein